MTNTCSTCKWADRLERRPGPDGDETVMCRFPPPSLHPSPDMRPWPFCKLTDWCSHWTAKDA